MSEKAAPMEEEVSELSHDEIACLEVQRHWVRDFYLPESQSKIDSVEGKLSLLQIILDNRWIELTETEKLQCLGVVIGDAFVQEMGLTWVAITDKSGRNLGVVLEGTTLIVWPITMISQRVEAGESVDVRTLFSVICEWFDENRERFDQKSKNEECV